MNLKLSFLSFEGKSSGTVLLIRYLVILIVFLLPTSLALNTAPLWSCYSCYDDFSFYLIVSVIPVVMFLFLVQEKKRMNALIINKKTNNRLFFLLIISYLINYLSVWSDIFYFEFSGFFNVGLIIYLIFWKAKYNNDEEEKLAKKVFVNDQIN